MMNLDHLPKSQTVSDCLRLLGNVTGRSFLRPVDFADLQELWSWPALGRMVFQGDLHIGGGGTWKSGETEMEVPKLWG